RTEESSLGLSVFSVTSCSKALKVTDRISRLILQGANCGGESRPVCFVARRKALCCRPRASCNDTRPCAVARGLRATTRGLVLSPEASCSDTRPFPNERSVVSQPRNTENEQRTTDHGQRPTAYGSSAAISMIDCSTSGPS